MKLTVRAVATMLALGFAVYFASRALWWTVEPTEPVLLIAAIVLFLAVVVLAVAVDVRRNRRLPLPASMVVVAAAALIPNMVNLSLPAEALRAPFATWYIGAVGILGVVAAVRQRLIAGWAVLAVLALSAGLWLGFGDALALGLVGSIVWMVIAHLLVTFWERAVQDTERLAGIQQASSAWHATQQVRQRERRMRVQYALAVAGPSLTRVIETRGDLLPEERIEARVAEGRLRDEIRGANLLNDRARMAIEALRRRGATVTVFDEGGLEELDELQRERVRTELADVMQSATSARIIIRAPRDAEFAVTIVGRSALGESADEDSMELWHEIRRDLPAGEGGASGN